MEKNYVSWSLDCEAQYDEEGAEVGSTEYVLIEKIYVCPEDRRQGKAKSMMIDTLAEIKKSHAGLTVKIAALPFGEDPIEMDDLVSFYEKLGFHVADTEGHAVIMELQ